MICCLPWEPFCSFVLNERSSFSCAPQGICNIIMVRVLPATRCRQIFGNIKKSEKTLIYLHPVREVDEQWEFLAFFSGRHFPFKGQTLFFSGSIYSLVISQPHPPRPYFLTRRNCDTTNENPLEWESTMLCFRVKSSKDFWRKQNKCISREKRLRKC